MSKYFFGLLALSLAVAGCDEGCNSEPCGLKEQASICPIEQELNAVGKSVLNGLSSGDTCQAVQKAMTATLNLYLKTDWELGTEADQYAPSLPLDGKPVSSFPVYRPVGYTSPLMLCNAEASYDCGPFSTPLRSQEADLQISPPVFIVIPEKNAVQVHWYADTGDTMLTLVTATAAVVNGVKGVPDGTYAVVIGANDYPGTEKVAICPADETVFQGFISGFRDFAQRAENNDIGK